MDKTALIQRIEEMKHLGFSSLKIVSADESGQPIAVGLGLDFLNRLPDWVDVFDNWYKNLLLSDNQTKYWGLIDYLFSSSVSERSLGVQLPFDDDELPYLLLMLFLGKGHYRIVKLDGGNLELECSELPYMHTGFMHVSPNSWFEDSFPENVAISLLDGGEKYVVGAVLPEVADQEEIRDRIKGAEELTLDNVAKIRGLLIEIEESMTPSISEEQKDAIATVVKYALKEQMYSYRQDGVWHVCFHCVQTFGLKQSNGAYYCH